MKYLVKINLWAIGITMVLYITLFLGIFSQIIVGAIQIACFIAICTQIKKLSTSLKLQLSLYGIITTGTLTWAYIDNDFMMTLWWFSGLLAFYFLFITFQFEKQTS